jgi:hypothetical protein
MPRGLHQAARASSGDVVVRAGSLRVADYLVTANDPTLELRQLGSQRRVIGQASAL